MQAETPTTNRRHGSRVGVVERNIRSVMEVQQQAEEERTYQERIVDAVSKFSGSVAFIYVHGAILLFWIVANTIQISGIRPWDPAPFALMSTFLSVEAILVTSFVLAGQTRAAALAEKRAELDLQINLLSEHEITELISMVEKISRKLDIQPDIEDLDEIKQDVTPKELVEEIEKKEEPEKALAK